MIIFYSLFLDDNFEGVPTTSKRFITFGAQRDVFINNESKQQFISVRIVPPERQTSYTLGMDEISIWSL